MDKYELQAVKESASCIELAGRYTQLRRASGTEMEGPCPRCGGTNRFHAKADGWFCRQCHEEWGDSIELMRWLTGATFPEAIAMLQGNAIAPAPTHKAPSPAQSKSKPQSTEWRTNAARLLDDARKRLPDGPGADYLRSRGLAPKTWEDYHLGYLPAAQWVLPEYQQPAIVMPWYKGGEVVALRYRFLQMVNGEKVRSANGSVFAGVVFGGQAVFVRPDTSDFILSKRRAVVVEGELNGMSITQVLRDMKTDVFSIGAQDQHLSDAVVAFLARYGTRIVWMDAPTKVGRMVERIQAHTGLASQKTDANKDKTDANDCLQRGNLRVVMLNALEAGPDSESLKWDIFDSEMGE